MTPLSPVPFSILADAVGPLIQFGGFENAVETATGPIALVLIFAYSFLIAIVLPLPSEVVLIAGQTGLGFGLPDTLTLAVVIVISAVGKAAGSVVAFHIGHEAKRQSGPIIDRLRDSRFDIVERSERRTVELARQYGYVGLALALMVPFFPDTLSIYAFTILEEDYVKFAAATFVGSVGRLVVVAGILAPFFSL